MSFLVSFWVSAYFQGALHVSFREYNKPTQLEPPFFFAKGLDVCIHANFPPIGNKNLQQPPLQLEPPVLEQ